MKSGKNKSESEQDKGKNEFGLSRRKFLFYCGGVAGSMALLGCGIRGEGGEWTDTDNISDTLNNAARKPAVVWLSGQECTGCSIQFLNHEEPDITEIILDRISLRYQEAVMAASGEVATQCVEDAISEGGYILIVEGAIPGADDRFCEIGGVSFRKTVQRLSDKAAAVIAIGACASFGGIPRETPSKGLPVSDVVDGPVINLPHCPGHHEHLLTTIVYFLENEALPELDEYGRPVAFFSKRIHDQCRRRPQHDAGNFLNDWNDPAQRDWCLFMKGCRGPQTSSDCVVRKYNGGVNHCIDSGCPCLGCAEPTFLKKDAPLFAAKEVSQRKGHMVPV
jgi:hydrogenase small subunit